VTNRRIATDTNTVRQVFVYLEVKMTFFGWLKFMIDAARYRRAEKQLEKLRRERFG